MDYSHKIIPPRYDVVFKAIFGKEESKPLIISLLSSILTTDISNLEDLMIMNSELPSDYVDGKGSRLDLRLKLKDKTEIDVEIQSYNHAAFSERVLYYWSKLYSNDFVKGEAFKDLKKCIVINFLDFKLYEDPSMHAVFKVYEASRHLLFSDRLEIHMIELPKIEGYNKGIVNPLLINWMAFLNVRSESDMAELKSKDDHPEEILIDPNMRMEALNKEMWIRDQIGLINYAKNAESDGYAKGIEQGIEQGIERGMREKAITIARQLLSQLDNATIAKVTGLSVEDVQNLREAKLSQRESGDS